jgi:thiol-disulfide isomerase/thioredoxin
MNTHRHSFHPQPALLKRCVGCLLAALLLAAGSAGAWPPSPGDVPPARLGKTSSGERVRLADYHGQVVIVTFWISRCGPCRKELKMLADLQQQAAPGTLQVLAVNYEERFDRFQKAVKGLGQELNNAPLKYISDDDGYYAREFGVYELPHMVIVGRDGRIVAVHKDYEKESLPGLAEEINRLLAEPAGAAVSQGS